MARRRPSRSTQLISGNFGIQLQKHIIDVAPPPVLARLKGLDDWMAGVMVVLGSMLVWGVIAAADVPTGQANAQMNPCTAHFQAIFTTLRTRRHIPDLVFMNTHFFHSLFHWTTGSRIALSRQENAQFSVCRIPSQ